MSSIMKLKEEGKLFSGTEVSSKSIQLYVSECAEGTLVEGFVEGQFIQAIGLNELDATGRFFLLAAETVNVTEEVAVC